MMVTRTISLDRAARLQQATAMATLDYLKQAGGGVAAHVLALGLAEALTTMLGHVDARHRAATLEKCRAILAGAERRTR